MPVKKLFRCAAVMLICVGFWEVAAGSAALRVEGAWALPTAPGATVAAVYLSIVNDGAAEDRLLAVDSPLAANAAMHESRIVNGMMQMRAVSEVVCPAHAAVQVSPGGLHLMLTGLAKPLQSGSAFPLSLHFRAAGTVIVNVSVKPAA